MKYQTNYFYKVYLCLFYTGASIQYLLRQSKKMTSTIVKFSIEQIPTHFYQNRTILVPEPAHFEQIQPI